MWRKLACSCGALGGVLALSVVPVLASAQRSGPISGARLPIPGAPVGVTAFVNVSVIPMDRERVLADQTVLVEGGRIAALGPASQVTVPAGAVRVDGRGQYLIPGLAEMHGHFQQAADSATMEWFLLRWLADGVTTFRNLDKYQFAEKVDPLRFKARAAAGELLSPRIYTAGQWAPEPLLQSSQVDPQTQQPKYTPRLDSVAAYVAAYKAKGFDFIKPYGESLVVMDSLLAAAHRERIPVAGHVTPGATVKYAIQGGYASIEHFYGSDSPKLPEIAAAMKRAGVWYCPTLTLVAGFGLAGTDAAGKEAMKKAYRSRSKVLQDAGAGLLLGSDDNQPYIRSVDSVVDLMLESGDSRPKAGAYRTSELEGIDGVQIELQLLVQLAGLTPYQALRAGTTNVAAFFDTLDETGTVAVGKRADLVLLPDNPLADIRHTARPAGVMLGGRWLPRAELIRELARRLAELPKPVFASPFEQGAGPRIIK